MTDKAYNTKTKQWVTSFVVTPERSVMTLVENGDRMDYQLNPDVVLVRCTGLKDKDSIDMLEGSKIEYFIENTVLVGYVVYDENYARFGVEPLDNNKFVDFAPFSSLNHMSTKTKVIGHKFDSNPELLTN